MTQDTNLTEQEAIDMVNHYYNDNPNVVATDCETRGIVIEVERNESNHRRSKLDANVTGALQSMGFNHLSSETYDGRTQHKYAEKGDQPASVALREWEAQR